MLKESLKTKAAIGSWIQIPSPDICEIAAASGIDWFAVDMEHTEISYESLPDMFRAVKDSSTAPFIRTRTNDRLEIRRALDIGAKGVIIPLVETAEDAMKAVESAKYPPEGVRGFAFCRANGWGRNFDEYVKTANKETMVLVMIESRRSVENIEEILEVNGLDGVFIGPYDMSGSYGVTGNPSHPLVEEACNKVVEACNRAGKIAGKHIVNPDREYIQSDIRKGFSMIAVGIDVLFLRNGFDFIAKMNDGK